MQLRQSVKALVFSTRRQRASIGPDNEYARSSIRLIANEDFVTFSFTYYEFPSIQPGISCPQRMPKQITAMP